MPLVPNRPRVRSPFFRCDRWSGLRPGQRSLGRLAFAAGLTVIGAPFAVGGADAVFTDATAAAGIDASQGPLFGDSFLAGGAVGDFNGDGFQDIFYPTGGMTPDRLYLNTGDGTFTDEAVAAGLALAHRGTAAAVADYNDDGRLDLFVTSLGPAGGAADGFHKLYRNEGNDGDGVPVFTDVAVAAGVNDSTPSGIDGYGAAWGDYDLDGDLDLAVAGWNSGSNNRVFRNNGDGTFDDLTETLGLGALATAGTNGFAPRFADMDGDRYPELIWIGDFGTSLYFRNDGGTFTDITASTGTGLDFNEMGITVADFDRDGDFDFYVTTIGTNNLYINAGGHSYTNEANLAGVSNTAWGWGTVAIDADHDGIADIAATTQSGRQWFFRGTGVIAGIPRFVDRTNAAGFVTSISGRGLANADFDNDGDQDLVIFPRSGPLTLFRNDLDASGGDANWLRVFLDNGGASGITPNGIGSVVRVSAGGQTSMGRIDGGSNYLSQSELSAHFGVGDASVIDELRIEWTDGSVTTLEDVAVNQTLTVEAGGAACLADIAEPTGVLDLADLQAFVSAFVAGAPVADVAEPVGVFDLADLQTFVAAFLAGCP